MPTELRVSVILLAAGLSKRMGSCKQLLPLNGTPVIVHILEQILDAGSEEIIVVTNALSGDVESAMAHLPVSVIRNEAADSDMAGSIRVGLSRVAPTAWGVLVCLADTPLVTAETCRRLIQMHRHCPEAILIPCYQGRKGHPVLFPRAVLEQINRQPTLRDVIRSNLQRVQLIDVHDSGVLEDMDTPEDYQRVILRFNSRS